MHIPLWIGIGVGVVTVIAVVVAARRRTALDAGTMSGQWIAEHHAAR